MTGDAARRPIRLQDDGKTIHRRMRMSPESDDVEPAIAEHRTVLAAAAVSGRGRGHQEGITLTQGKWRWRRDLQARRGDERRLVVQ